ncbi:MAG: DUF2147 domain-containing protein [Crocinitomicaceae bacterium]
MKQLIFVLALVFSSIIVAQNWKQSDYVGKWRTYDDKTGEPNGKIELYLSNGSIVAKVLEGPYVRNADGSMAKDVKNPDEKLRTRLILGMNFLYGFQWDAENTRWIKGRVYDSRSGNTYSAKLELVEKDKMKLTGYMGITLFGKSVYWTRLK